MQACTRRIGVLLVAGLLAGCRGTSLPLTLEQLTRGRSLASDISVQFARSAEASNRAVMADSEGAAAAAAREAREADGRVEHGMETLKPILDGLGYGRERMLLGEFAERFGHYKALDREILDLAVENTNLEAQRLSFGAGQDAADAVRDALARAVPPSAPAAARALAATALADVREIQVIQPRHIAEARDEAMTSMETRMAASESAARHDLGALEAEAGVVRSAVADAVMALDRFVAVNAELVKLSRRNSDVRSLALSLGEKRTAVAACEASLDALQAALDSHTFAATR